METILIQLIVQSIMVGITISYIIDFAQIAEIIKEKLYYIRYTKDSVYEPYTVKPFDCSGCLSFWVTLGMILIISTFNIYTIPLSALSGLTSITIRKYIIL